MAAKFSAGRHDGLVHIVTGGGSGIGAAAARRLAGEGACVTVADVRAGLAEAVAAEIAAAGGRAIAVACDVADEAQVAAMVARTVEAFGRVDGLFSNAGTAGRGWIHETTVEDWRRVLDINLTGAFLCAKHVLPHFLAAGSGVVVTTGSIASVVIGAGGSAASYAASKGGLLQLTRQIAVDYGPQGVRAACVCPGAVTTGLGAHAAEDRQGQATPAGEPLPRSRFTTPMARAADPDEIATAVSFLMSDEASFITGAALMVDGGLTAI
ncbi:SDR family oxidoreductase [Phenylobacterium sp.]|jgi:3-oxoacyl-[acyl-carrier protein] reductase|uniref:SDR family oxidoreductase n=1 Tax=Phenylobacterium sp. TaxID=1871053 RepID=UPI002E37B8A6|nr:SDR family oxidoreductase [Phenylobacterium sp.]HEX3367776.1 SDR family oxidoreductase [Phenylobacterium sp.]